MQGSCTEAAEQLCETEAAMQLAAEQLLSSYTEMHKEAAMMQLAAEQLAAEQLLSSKECKKEAARQLAAEQLLQWAVYRNAKRSCQAASC